MAEFHKIGFEQAYLMNFLPCNSRLGSWTTLCTLCGKPGQIWFTLMLRRFWTPWRKIVIGIKIKYPSGLIANSNMLSAFQAQLQLFLQTHYQYQGLQQLFLTVPAPSAAHQMHLLICNYGINACYKVVGP